jgi:hypothetical protein
MPERFGRNGAFTCVSGAEAAVVAGAGRESRLGDDPLRPTRPAPCEIGQPVPCGPERCPPSLGTVERVSDTRPPYSPQGPTPQCNSYQRRHGDLVRLMEAIQGNAARGSAALHGVMHPPEGGPQAVFRFRSASVAHATPRRACGWLAGFLLWFSGARRASHGAGARGF